METKTAFPKNDNGQKDVYTIVTDRIIDQLNKGTVPWRKPWASAGVPANLISQRPYSGINLMLLACLGYERNLFLTSKQLNHIGGTLKPDEKPHLVVFWNYFEKDEEDNESEGKGKKKMPYLRYYTVFNVAQCEGIPEKYMPVAARQAFTIDSCEAIVKGMPLCPQIKHKEQRAYYDPLRDYVNMPKKASFEDDTSYYSTLYHELVHSTGHRNRLNRKDVIEMTEFGSEPYSHEELVAEIGACYLQSFSGIEEQFEQSAGYIQGWLTKLQNDRKFIFSAAKHAQKATDFILNVKPEETVAEGKS